MDHLLRASRQTHGEHGLCLVGPPFNRAVMGLGNFARNIQPESESAPVFALLIRASRQWVKNPLRRLLVNDGTAVPDFKTNFRVMTRCYNADWPVRRALPATVILDIQMPRLDGWTVAKEIRRLTDSAAPLLLAVTGLSTPSERAESIRCGFVHHFIKPAPLPDFLAAIVSRPS